MQSHSTSRSHKIRRVISSLNHTFKLMVFTFLALVSFINVFRRQRLTMNRVCSTCTIGFPMPSFTTYPSTYGLRIICNTPYSNIHGIHWHAFLALQKLSHFMAIPLRNRGHLGIILPYPSVLSELGQSVQHVFFGWRGCMDINDARKCSQDYYCYQD